jgi:hypothetical protein
LLYSDITGGIATSIAKLVSDFTNTKLDARDRKRELNNIISNSGFAKKFKNKEQKTVTKIFETIKATDREYSENINGAKALNKNGYNVYMLPRTNKTSPDYLLEKVNGGDKFLAELKTIYGKNSLDNRLNDASRQADRIVLNIVGSLDSRYTAETIKSFYEKNLQIKQIIVLKSGKSINIMREQIEKKNFVKEFMKKWVT